MLRAQRRQAWLVARGKFAGELHDDLAGRPLARMGEAELEVDRTPVVAAGDVRGDLESLERPSLDRRADHDPSHVARVRGGQSCDLRDVVGRACGTPFGRWKARRRPPQRVRKAPTTRARPP